MEMNVNVNPFNRKNFAHFKQRLRNYGFQFFMFQDVLGTRGGGTMFTHSELKSSNCNLLALENLQLRKDVTCLAQDIIIDRDDVTMPFDLNNEPAYSNPQWWQWEQIRNANFDVFDGTSAQNQ